MLRFALAALLAPPAGAQSAPVQTPPRPFITRLFAASPSSLRLAWSVEGGAPVDGFRIVRDGVAVATLGAGAREWRDAGLKPATVYSYSVAAFAGASEAASAPLADVTRLANEGGRAVEQRFDIVVAGATPGGIAAALAAARLGRRVALLSPSPWIGGMMTGGLSRTDFGSAKSAGGFFREFTERARLYYARTYGADSPQLRASRNGYYFEPRVAKWIFHQMLAEEPNVTLFLDHHTQDVEKEGPRVRAVYVLDRPRLIRKTLRARVFIDATYEGDLAAQAGAPFRVGRESREEFAEEHAGELFWEPTSRRVIAGSGRGDRRVQSYNFRLCLSRDPSNRLPFPPPDGARYNRARFATLLPAIASGRVKSLEQVLSILPLPNEKWDANNHPLGNPSSDLIGGADLFPESGLREREQIAEAHRQHILGLMYFVQSDPEVPAAFRAEASRWGLARDEFVDNGRWPTQLYVREGRRIMGPTIFSENDARSGDPAARPNFHPDSIGVADYPIDSHATNWEKDGLLEGFFYLPGAQTLPSQIPYRTMTPLNVEGVLVCGSVSSTHIGYGTLRMEPVFLSLGLAAGAAAHLALEKDVALSQLDAADLQRFLLSKQQVICVFDDVPLGHPRWEALQFFGARGFFPLFKARPDEPVAADEAARWLWRWAREQRPGLQAPPGSDALGSLRHWNVVAMDEGVEPGAPLASEAAGRWVERARAIVQGRNAQEAPVAEAAAGAAVTRAELCGRLYEAGRASGAAAST